MRKRQGIRVIVAGTQWEYDHDWEAHEKAKRLAEAQVVHSMEVYDLPGESLEQKAARLQREKAALERWLKAADDRAERAEEKALKLKPAAKKAAKAKAKKRGAKR